MYLETTAESFEMCRAICHYHHTSRCIIFAFTNPGCYLGDPLGDFNTITATANVYVWGDYRKDKTSLIFKSQF